MILAKLDLIEYSLQMLNRGYFLKCVIKDNPIVTDLITEYLNYAGGREGKIRLATPLCLVKAEMFIIFGSSNNSTQPPYEPP